MNTNTTLSLTEARKGLFRIADEAAKTSRYYTLTEKGRAKVVLMSAIEFESWVETIDVMRDFPHLLEDVKKAEVDYRKGDVRTYEEFLKAEGLVLGNRPTARKRRRT